MCCSPLYNELLTLPATREVHEVLADLERVDSIVGKKLWVNDGTRISRVQITEERPKPKTGLWFACLNSRSPHYNEWLKILGAAGDVPLVSPYTVRAQLGESGFHPCYLLNVHALALDQFRRLVDHLVAKFGADEGDVVHDLMHKGMPIRQEDVIVAISAKAVL